MTLQLILPPQLRIMYLDVLEHVLLNTEYGNPHRKREIASLLKEFSSYLTDVELARKAAHIINVCPFLED